MVVSILTLLRKHVVAKLLSDTNEDGDHRYLLFSATFNKEMRKLARKFLAVDHVRIRIGRAGSVHANVKQQVSFPCLSWSLCLLICLPGDLRREKQQATSHLRPASSHAAISYTHLLQLQEGC